MRIPVVSGNRRKENPVIRLLLTALIVSTLGLTVRAETFKVDGITLPVPDHLAGKWETIKQKMTWRTVDGREINGKFERFTVRKFTVFKKDGKSFVRAEWFTGGNCHSKVTPVSKLDEKKKGLLRSLFGPLELITSPISQVVVFCEFSGESTGSGDGGAGDGAPGEGDIPTPGDLPEPGDVPSSGDIPMPGDGDIPNPGDVPSSGDLPEPADVPGIGDIPEPGDIPGSGDIPDPGDIPGSGDLPDPGDVPGSGDLPVPADNPGGSDVPVPSSGDLPGLSPSQLFGGPPGDIPIPEGPAGSGDVPSSGDIPMPEGSGDAPGSGDVPGSGDIPMPEGPGGGGTGGGSTKVPFVKMSGPAKHLLGPFAALARQNFAARMATADCTSVGDGPSGDGPANDDDDERPGDGGGNSDTLRFGFNVKKYSSPAGSLEFTLIGERNVCIEATSVPDAIQELRDRFPPHIRPANAERISYRFFPNPSACNSQPGGPRPAGGGDNDRPIRPIPDPGETERPVSVDIPT